MSSSTDCNSIQLANGKERQSRQLVHTVLHFYKCDMHRIRVSIIATIELHVTITLDLSNEPLWAPTALACVQYLNTLVRLVLAATIHLCRKTQGKVFDANHHPSCLLFSKGTRYWNSNHLISCKHFMNGNTLLPTSNLQFFRVWSFVPHFFWHNYWSKRPLKS